jgi:TolB-like protein
MLVISRGTAFSYRNRPVGAKQIREELGVRYVLEGSVRRSGGRVRVNAQLINTETQHRGRIVKNTGDGFLAEFPSVVERQDL